MIYKYLTICLIIFSGIFSSYPESGIRLIEHHSSKYNIIIPAQPTEVEKHSAEELQKYLDEMTGVKLNIVNDSEPETQYEILIGRNNRLQKLDLNINFDSLALDGFTIKTAGKKLVIAGGSKKGTLYGVYTFLDKYLGCKMYTPDAIYIPKKKWHKLNHYSEREKYYGTFVHTFFKYLSPGQYFKTHPEYFSEINGIRVPQQLCLSNPDVYKIVLDSLKYRMKEKPEATVWDVSQNDNFGYCTCNLCSRTDSIYGSPSGSIIKFVNKIAEQFPNKTITTLAYQYSRKAPVGIKPDSNVMVVLCTIECDRSKPIADQKNDLFNRDINDWSKITNKLKIWDYVVQFSSYMDPFPNFYVLMFVKHGVKYLFEQGSGDSKSDMHELKAYLLAKLMWNPDANVENIISEFLNGYYGNAGKYISEYFHLMHNALKRSGKGLIIYGYPSNGKDSYLTPDLLDKYTKLFDEAENSVAGDTVYLNRVKTARLPLEYAKLELSKLNISGKYRIFNIVNNKVIVNQKMKDLLDNFVKEANRSGVKRLHERGYSPDEYYADMQNYFKEGMIIHKAYHKDVKILSDLSPKYSADGPQTLVDGVIGEANYYFNWLGFEGNEFEAIVDLNKETDINSIRTDFLQEVKSWIWLPKSVEYFVSDDGKNFTKVGEVKDTISEKKDGIFTEPFACKVKNVKARYVKVQTKSQIHCPRWHIGYNNGKGKAWLFVDEIVVK
ncbi:MAG: DUF4838 domain-containing protein [Ignavibacteriaceae bacterium]